ncbi:MAG: endolytic transglycosylase MltG [Pseudomonadota bacterium]
MNKSRSYLLSGIGFLAVMLIARLMLFYEHVHQPLRIVEPYILEVSSGDTFRDIVIQLGDEKILRSGIDLRIYARVKGLGNQIRAGEYELSPGITPLGLLDTLVNGKVRYHTLRLGEGWTLEQAIDAIQQHPAVIKTLNSKDHQSIQAAFNIEFYPEGFFFPDTYSFIRGTTDLQILQQAWDLMQNLLADAWPQRDEGLPYTSPRDALVMASIIEKETALADEYAQIAGVFIRRLQQNIRLQTDPTVIYGLGATFDGNLTRLQLQEDTPWNTYTRFGLPPTPIALPGKAAIEASLHPQAGDTLFFVARGDGSHQFSTTLEEHNLAVQQYQLGVPPKNE